MYSPQDVDVRQGGFHHHDVRPFVDIQSHLTQRFVRVGVIQLVGTTIAKLRRALGCLAKRTVKSRRKFGRITHNPSLIEAAGIERVANSADPAVHHITGCDQVRAGRGMRKCSFNQKLDSFIIEYVEVVAIDSRYAAVPVAHIFAQTDISDYDETRAFCFDGL